MSSCRRLLLLAWMRHDRCCPTTSMRMHAGMNERWSLLSDDLDGDAVQEIIQRTWPHHG
jgi:hypothetical protein